MKKRKSRAKSAQRRNAMLRLQLRFVLTREKQNKTNKTKKHGQMTAVFCFMVMEPVTDF